VASSGGEGSAAVTGPVLAIYLYGDRYQIKTRWGAAADAYRNLWRGPVVPDRGTWIDWLFCVTWAEDDSGRVRAWKNGASIIDYTGVTFNGGEWAPYFKFGIYKWPWRRPAGDAPSVVDRRLMWIDEIRIGTSADAVRSDR
jgi:hypothetical protein